MANRIEQMDYDEDEDMFQETISNYFSPSNQDASNKTNFADASSPNNSSREPDHDSASPSQYLDNRIKMDVDNETSMPHSTKINVEIRELPTEIRAQYSTIESDVIESVSHEDVLDDGNVLYTVQFTDGREEQIYHQEILTYDQGEEALLTFYEPKMPTLGKRKRHDDEWESERDTKSLNSNLMELEVNDDDAISQKPRSLRLRGSKTRPSTISPSQPDNDDSDEARSPSPSPPKRILRARPPPKVVDLDKDELADDPRQDSEGSENDLTFSIVTSDVVQHKGRPRRSQMRTQSRRLANQSRLSAKRRTPGSDIEFEAPRRSGRSTQNKVSMQDFADDDDVFEMVEDKVSAAPKVISIREVFQPVPSDSPFASVHIESCHTCGQSRSRGQLVHCQGCSLSYHKGCLGYRSAREHMVTKVGEDNFVLQCRFCIGVHRKKDRTAPKFAACQSCRDSGEACSSFSSRKSVRQEEKIREENGGVDPITPVSPRLLNNPAAVLFRCVKCHRGWHIKHLPPTGDESVTISTDLRTERLKDYSIDWTCNDCKQVREKIQRPVAWRPTKAKLAAVAPDYSWHYSRVSEDDKEYLIKWENTSYYHCTWKPGAWFFGTAAGASRVAFGKRDAEESLMKLNKEDAIPDEYLMPEIILNVKMDSSASRPKSKAEQLESISHIKKIYVKFQGLSYDEVVWDMPPAQGSGQKYYDSFLSAYYDYVEGKFFENVPASKIRARIKAFQDADFVEVDEQPAGLTRGKLMGYQLEGLNWLLENYHRGRSVVLADEMGLGKTVQVVSLVASLVQDSPKVWPFLIVVPNSTCPNWRREFKQWTPDLRVVTYHGGKIPQERAYKFELFPNESTEIKAHVVIMSYDSAADPKTRVLFKSVPWAGLVVDEGQRLKNDQNLLYLALQELKIPFRLLLTGTPLQNNKRELFNLIQFIDKSQNAEKLDAEYEVLDKETLPKLHEQIRPYFLRRTKAGVLKFLPPMAQIILPVTMTVIQEKLSKNIIAKNPQLIKAMFANTKISKKDRGSLNNILMQLRKVLSHPFIYSHAIEEHDHDAAVIHRNLVQASSKLILLELMLPKLKERGHRVLIFSQFLDQLSIVEDFLSGVGYGYRRLDGSISSLERQKCIDAFNAPDSDIFAFLLSTRAGGVGINLATADTVIIMDPDFNPHQDIQALSRAHRIGQKRKVLCFQMVTKDSAEERIMQIGRKKMALDHALIETMDDNEVDGDDLESIIKHGAQALFNDDYQKSAIHYDSDSVDQLLDRSHIEQADVKDDAPTDAQFTYAKVWSNQKAGFEDSLGIGTEENEAPEPINSSVWDSILAQREEEARKEAEANREVLGRGGRRRMAPGSYKTHHTAQPNGPGSQESSSDEFSGGESPDESDEGGGLDTTTSKGNKRRLNPSQIPITPTVTPKKAQVKNKVNKAPKQRSKQKQPHSSPNKGKTGAVNSSQEIKRRKHMKPNVNVTQLLTPPPSGHTQGSKAKPSSGQTGK